MASFADYQIVMIDIVTGELLDIISQDRWNALTYNRVLNDVSKCEFTVPLSDQSSSYRDLDTIIEVYRRPQAGASMQREQTYLLRYVSIYYDEDTETEYITRSGVSPEDLLKRRIIVPADDPNNAGGYISYQDNAGTIMNTFASRMMSTPAVNADRAFPNMFFITDPYTGNVIFQRRAWEVLFDVIFDCSVKGDIDFELYRFLDNTVVPPSFVFWPHRVGTDKSKTANFPTQPYILFTPQRANMRQPILTLNRLDERNSVFVLGQGTEGAREVLPVEGNTIPDSPYNRIEGTTDARDVSYGVTDGFLTAGNAFLQENEPQITFDFVPDLDSPQGRYTVDWNIGDIVTALYQGYEADFRIMQVSVSLTDDNEDVTVNLLKKSQFEGA